MNLFFGIIIGFILGAVIFYFLEQRKVKLANQKLQQTRQALEESEILNKQNETQIQELQSAHQAEVQKLENSYQTRIQQLQAKGEEARQENRLLAEQYENQSQQLRQVLAENQVPAEDEIEGDFRADIEAEAESPEEIIEIDSLLDLLSEVTAEPETTTIAPEQEIKQPAPVEKSDLAQEIMAIGESGDATKIHHLTEYIYNPDSRIRASVACAFGKIAEANSLRAEIQRLIPILGNLSQDSEPSVRQSAITALGKIKSINVIPFLKIAQRDTDSDVVKSASAALTNFKGYSQLTPKKRLPKNARLIKTSL